MLAHVLLMTALLLPADKAKTEPAPKDAAASPPSVGGIAPIETANWLVHLARHQGHLVGRSDPRSASLHVLALLEAAVDTSPDCAEAHFWLYDLYYRLGRDDDARKALNQYVRLHPDDDTARLRLLELDLADRQTAEARVEFLQSEIERQALPRGYESQLHGLLGRHHFERYESEFAAAELERALRLNPLNVSARALAYEMFGETEPALQRVEMALQLIAMNPAQANLVWDLAEFLDRLSLHAQAQEWYGRAIEIHKRSSAGDVPPELLQKLALSCVCSGEFEKAKKVTDEILEAHPDFHAARLLRAHAETKLDRAADADDDMLSVARAYQGRIGEVLEKKSAAEAAEMAWFYAYHQPDKERALKLAKLAMDEPKPSILARLAYAYALRLNGKTDEAVAALEPLAGVDQLAALELAKAQIERGDKAQAITTLHKAATIQYSGIAYDLIADLLTRNGENPPQPPLHAKVAAALDKFPRDVLEYYQRPGDFLKFTARFADEQAPAVGPINVVFRAENAGPFVISFGEGFMTRPLVAVSARVRALDGRKKLAADEAESKAGDKDEQPASFDNYLQVLMNSRPMLMPGEAVEKVVAIDVGPIREHLIRTVTQSAEIELTAMWDPVFADDKLVSGLGTVTAGPVKVMRRGVDASPEAVAALVQRASSPDAVERAGAADLLGALRADAERRKTESQPSNLPPDAISTAMATLLQDENWHVRARATVAVGWAPLDARVTNAAAGGIRGKPPAVVKLLAVRLFAEHHGAKFTPVLQQLSKSDPSPFVRTMAESYLPRPSRVVANGPSTSAQDAVP